MQPLQQACKGSGFIPHIAHDVACPDAPTGNSWPKQDSNQGSPESHRSVSSALCYISLCSNCAGTPDTVQQMLLRGGVASSLVRQTMQGTQTCMPQPVSSSCLPHLLHLSCSVSTWDPLSVWIGLRCSKKKDSNNSHLCRCCSSELLNLLQVVGDGDYFRWLKMALDDRSQQPAVNLWPAGQIQLTTQGHLAHV